MAALGAIHSTPELNTSQAGPGSRPLAAAGVRWLVLALILVAFGLRTIGLATQSLWHDEAGSLAQAGQSVPAIVFDIEPAHLPFYFLVLKVWIGLAGSGEFAARYLSVLGSVLIVPLLWWTGSRLGGRPLGITAALVGTATPQLLHYGQEIRMYVWLPVVALLALGSQMEAWRTGRRRWWIAHGIALALGAHLHYYGVLPVLGSVSVQGSRRFWRKPAERSGWLIAMAIVGVLYLPWILIRATAISGVTSTSGSDFSLAALLWRGLVGLLLGHHLEREALVITDGLASDAHLLAARLLAPLAGLLLIGLIGAWLTRPLAFAVIVGWAVVPFLTVYLISLGGRDFGSRYLMAAAPAIWLAVAFGVVQLARLWRPLVVAGLAAVLVPMLWSSSLYFDPAYAREDNRSLAQYVATRNQPGDAILFNAWYNAVPFRYYAPDAPIGYPMPAAYPPDQRRIVADLERIATQHERVWLMLWQDYYSDPHSVVKGWLDQHGVQIDGQVFHGLTLYRYLTRTPIFSAPPAISHPLDLTFDERIRLIGYDLVTVPESSNQQPATVRLSLYWSPLVTIPTSYRVFVQLVNPVYHVYGQEDHRPVFDRFPTDRWQPGTIIRDDYQIVVDSGTPPGLYQLAVGLYDQAAGSRLSVTGSDRRYALLGPVPIEQSRAPTNPTVSLAARLGESVELIGYDLAGQAVAGGSIQLTLHWRAVGQPPPGASVFTHLLNERGELVAQKDNPPAAGTFPTDHWSPGITVRDRYDLQLPPALPAGRYTLLTGMYLPNGQRLAARPGRSDGAVQLTVIGVVP